MLKLSKLIDYATIILICLDQYKTVVSSSTVASKTHIPEPTVAKILKMLTKASLTKSSRGPGSGYSLIRNLNEITLSTVVEVIEGPIKVVNCDNNVCRIESEECILYGKWEILNQRIKNVLDTFTLAELQKNSIKLKNK